MSLNYSKVQATSLENKNTCILVIWCWDYVSTLVCNMLQEII
jgi:hypothetical protein